MLALRYQYPEHKILKVFTTQAHGSLVARKNKFLDDSTTPPAGYRLTSSSGNRYLKNHERCFIDPNHAFISEFARLKPFIFSQQRKYVYDHVIQPYQDRIVRIVTDGFLIKGKVDQFDHPKTNICGDIAIDDHNPYYQIINL